MDDGSWQDNLSDYNSDFSMPSDQEDGNIFFKLHFNPIWHEIGVGTFIPFYFGAPNDDGSWQDNLSVYNSDFSIPSDQKDGNNIYIFFKLHSNPICHGKVGGGYFFDFLGLTTCQITIQTFFCSSTKKRR